MTEQATVEAVDSAPRYPARTCLGTKVTLSRESSV